MARKRSNGSGTIQKVSNGVWRGRVMDGYKPDGSKNIVSFYAPTKGEVQALIRNYWFEHPEEDDAEEENIQLPTFAEWADSWYAQYKTQVQPSTYCNYKYTLAILKAYFQEQKLIEIKPVDVTKFHSHLLSLNKSKSSVSKCRAMLIQILDFAEANELVPYNAARKAMAIKIVPTLDFLEDSDGKKDAFTEQEQEILAANLPDNVVGHTIRLMLGTGLRAQEMLALTPKDIAADCSSISVSKAIKTVDGSPTLGPTKSKKGRRVVPIPENYRKDARYLIDHSGKPYIWTSRRKNGLYDVGAFRRRYYNALKAIPGVRPLSPHCCRHTYVSNLAKRGVSLHVIANLVGHSKISTTCDVYVHTDLSTLTDAVSVLNNTNH